MPKQNKNQLQQNALFQQSIPKMPEGYYSGDKPNPNLCTFAEAHVMTHPYDPEHDTYDVPAFNTPINTTKATAIYNMHTYWSKKPHDAIRQYIEHYTQPGDLVLDPFCGSGGTALAALMSDRKAIAIDRSPAATFITKNYCTPVDVEALQQAFEELKLKVQPELDWLYETRCDRCEGPATTSYTVYSQVFECPRCSEKVPLFDCQTVDSQTAQGKTKKVNVCPYCYEKGFEEVIRSQSQKFGYIPVLVGYSCQGSCETEFKHAERQHKDIDTKKREYFEKYDLGKSQEIESKFVPYWYPKGYDMQSFSRYQRDALFYYNIKEVSDLFTKRNLWTLAVIRDKIMHLKGNVAFPLLFSFSGVLLGMSRMNRYRPDVSYPTNIMNGIYYIPQIMEETVPWTHFANKCKKIFKAYNILASNIRSPKICISTENATKLTSLPTASVDYIFTDPPYADKVQYGELNFVWEAWLGFDTHWHDEEIIVNEVRGKSEADWANMMKQAIAECHRVLKPGRWISLCYHDTSAGTWARVQDIMAEVGFVADTSNSALFIDTGQKSYNQLTADKVTKRDLVINFRKPKLDEPTPITITGDEDETTFAEKVHTIIKIYLTAHSGETKDHTYDEVVSRMVRAGQMEAHNFDDLLRQVAEPAAHDQMSWHLLKVDETEIDQSEYAKEEHAARVITSFLEQEQDKHPEQEGVHYSNIFEHFLSAIPDKEKPRRLLNEWLQDYFYTTNVGTYRLPANEEEHKAKQRGRLAGTNRLIKRYLSYLQQNIAIPATEQPDTTTLVEWIRHCRRSSLYEQGRTLFEKGGLDLDQLSEEQQVEVEEDYQVCVRQMGLKQQKPVKTKPVQLNISFLDP
jgi:DNA modification methylase